MNRQEWLEKRRETLDDGGPRIQASELPVILWGDATALYLDKIGLGENVDSIVMARGRRWESVVADEYAEQTGRPVFDPGAYVIQQHPTIPWLGATLDRRTVLDARPIPLQLKVALGRAREWEAGPPLRVLTQVQAEVACDDAPAGAIGALTNYFAPLQTFDVERDDEFLALALPHVEAFRDRVRRRIPPEPRSSEALPALRRLYGAGDGTTVELDQAGLELAVQWERGREASESAGEWAEECKAKLIALMGGASFARLPDRSLLALRKWGSGVALRREWR